MLQQQDSTSTSPHQLCGCVALLSVCQICHYTFPQHAHVKGEWDDFIVTNAWTKIQIGKSSRHRCITNVGELFYLSYLSASSPGSPMQFVQAILRLQCDLTLRLSHLIMFVKFPWSNLTPNNAGALSGKESAWK
uniref:Uncharacterized protein n=1 Tax=Spongospora subterranea TaxID=70186 RepID=A0A0H5QEP8_9EUKA|eukprot:CRZ00528.1 hypothetical protein [Spongospora subterranea]